MNQVFQIRRELDAVRVLIEPLRQMLRDGRHLSANQLALYYALQERSNHWHAEQRRLN